MSEGRLNPWGLALVGVTAWGLTAFASGASSWPPSSEEDAAGRFVIRDDGGRDIEFLRSPHRIISLLPSLTETLCALDACDRLVATDRFSNWPPSVSALPKAGGLDDAAVELIVSLKPDLVLVSRAQRSAARLRELNVRTVVLNAQTYADIGRIIAIIGQILGAPDRAAALEQRIDVAVADIARSAEQRRHGAAGPRVYFEVDRAPYAAGPQSYIGELLSRLGARNVVPAPMGPYPKLNPEFVVSQDPEVMFVTSNEASRLIERPGWGSVRAVKEHRVCSFAPAVQDTIVRPGPRVAEGMRVLAECLDRMSP